MFLLFNFIRSCSYAYYSTKTADSQSAGSVFSADRQNCPLGYTPWSMSFFGDPPETLNFGLAARSSLSFFYPPQADRASPEGVRVGEVGSKKGHRPMVYVLFW